MATLNLYQESGSGVLFIADKPKTSKSKELYVGLVPMETSRFLYLIVPMKTRDFYKIHNPTYYSNASRYFPPFDIVLGFFKTRKETEEINKKHKGTVLQWDPSTGEITY